MASIDICASRIRTREIDEMNIKQKAALLKKMCPWLRRLSVCDDMKRRSIIKKMNRKELLCLCEFMYNSLGNKYLICGVDRLRLKRCLLPFKRRLRLLCYAQLSFKDRKRLCLHVQECIPKMVKCGLPHLYHTLRLLE